MAVHVLEVGQLGVCCYIVVADGPADTAETTVPCVVIDPGDEADRITSMVKRLGFRVAAVFLTHAHVDHIGGVDALLDQWPDAALWCSAETSRRAGDPQLNLSVFMGETVSARPAGRIIRDGEEFEAAGLQWRAVEIPGHDPGEMVYVLGDGGRVFTGDTIFQGSVGRSDFPGGDGNALIAGARKLLLSLPADAVLYPGHGPATTAREELAYNPFLREV